MKKLLLFFGFCLLSSQSVLAGNACSSTQGDTVTEMKTFTASDSWWEGVSSSTAGTDALNKCIKAGYESCSIETCNWSWILKGATGKETCTAKGYKEFAKKPKDKCVEIKNCILELAGDSSSLSLEKMKIMQDFYKQECK